MKIAVPFMNGEVFDSFERSSMFKVYTTNEKEVVSTDILFVDVENKQSPVKLLKDNGVTVVIGKNYLRIGIMMLQRAGIEIIGGAEGDADKAVEEYIQSTLVTEERTSCGHTCGSADCDHSCHQ